MRNILVLAVLAIFLLIGSPTYAQVSLGTSASATNPQRSGDATTGLFSSATGAVSVSSAGTEMMRVTGTGVAIGTTTLNSILTVTGSGSNNGITINGNGTIMSLYNTDNTTALAFNVWGSSLGAGFYESENGGSTWYNPMTFLNGKIGIGTMTPANVLDIATNGGIHIASGVPSSTSNAVYNNSGSLAWNGALITSSAGQLQCSGGNCSNTTGSSTIAYCPYKGNVKTTASQGNYAIPSACLTATLTSMYVGGVASSSVSASTLYYIYLWNNSGTWVLDAETGGHATDSSTGIEIKSGDNTKTLVGMIHADANKKVMKGGQTNTSGDTNTVASWDNRIPTTTSCGFTTNRTSTSHLAQVEVNAENRCYFMSWGDAASFSSDQTGSSNTTGAGLTTWIQLDGAGVGYTLVSSAGILQTVANYTALLVAPGIVSPSEGFHYTVLSVEVNSGTTVTYGGGNATQFVSTVQ